MFSFKFLTIIYTLFFLPRRECLDCYICTNVTSVTECPKTASCKTGQVCFADHVQTTLGVLLSYGCKPSDQCVTTLPPKTTTGALSSGSIVGRSFSFPRSPICSECCNENNCNRKLCQNNYPTCADSPDSNCDVFGTKVNICLDTEHVKTTCRRFCGLCCYYDGSWSGWLTWSSCDVTCGNGSQTRERKCTEPAPSCGGHNCVGPSQDTQSCSLQPCPVHGGWSSWSIWGSCSVTCGIGLQRRDRTCSNPYPDRFGDHCFGDARDDQICIMDGCSDGGWAAWTSWTTCSRTCGEGIKSRSRACNNPVPSINGKYCEGDPYEVESCNIHCCQVINGHWGQWSDWTRCSEWCPFGLRSRFRNCNDPEPSSGGSLCSGSSSETEECSSTCKYTGGNWNAWTTQIGAKCYYPTMTFVQEQTCNTNICVGIYKRTKHCYECFPPC